MNVPKFRPRLAALALSATCGVAFGALPPFTLNPSAPGTGLLGGASFSADSIQFSDYSTVTVSGSTLQEVGFLPVLGFLSSGTNVMPQGLNSSYGLYFAFNGTGSVAPNGAGGTSGTFSSLSYTLYGYNGPATFGFDASNAPTTTAASPVALATGTFKSGFVATMPAAGGFVPSAYLDLTFNPSVAGFFQSPTPFYNEIEASFINNTAQVEPFDGGFRIRQGGGSADFVSSVPEPDTYALMFGGLTVIGFLASRRKLRG